MADFKFTGFADEISPDLSVQIEVLKKLGIHYIEPRGINGVNVSLLTQKQAQDAKKQLDQAKIKVSSIGSPIGKIGIEDDFEAHLQLFHNTIQVAKTLGANQIRIFSFYIPEGKNPDDYKDAVLNRLHTMIEIARENDIVLLHENERGIFGELSIRCKILAQELYCDNFKLVFDPANYVLCGEKDCFEALESLYPYTTYFHIKDAILKNEQVVPAGMGEGKLKEIISFLKEKDYHGFLSLEPHLAHFNGVDAFDKFNHLNSEEEAGERTFSIAHSALVKLISEC